MYSGTTIRLKSGHFMGVHQRIDRAARRVLTHHISRSTYFPTIPNILHFEGLNGPDGIKRKSPGRDEPWHYINPSDPTDRRLLDMINDHIYNLTEALVADNRERAAFEAAWLAHAITDGLTPAHHYPLEEKLEELRGEGMETRISVKQKILMPGSSRRHQLRNNWAYWGAKGVITTHFAFEHGVATVITGQRLEDLVIAEQDVVRLQQDGFEQLFLATLRHVASLNMYEEFMRTGWTRRLARETKTVLVPAIVEMVTLSWYGALMAAEKRKEQASES
jgi:hypothetical protein